MKRADRLWKELGNKSVVDMQVAGFTADQRAGDGHFAAHPTVSCESEKTDLIIAPEYEDDENVFAITMHSSLG